MATSTRLLMNSGQQSTGNLTTLNGVLKDVYLEGMTDTVFFDDSFTRLIESKTAKMDVTGRRIIHAFDTQRSGGVGPIAEGAAFRTSVPIDADQGFEWIKYSNMYFELTGPAIATVKQGQGSYVDIVSKHMKTMIKSAKMDVERVLMGAADARIGQIDSTATVDSASTFIMDGPGFFDTMYFEPGMRIEVRNDDFTSATLRDYDGTNNTMTVSGITKGNKATSTLGTVVVDQTLTTDGDIATGEWVTREDAYGAINGYSTVPQCLEGNGLMNLISDGATTASSFFGAETSDNFKKVWNIDRTAAGKEYLKSQINNIADALDEENLLQVIIESRYQTQADPNLLIVTPRALLKYFLNSKEDRRFNTMEAMEWTGGYTGLGIQLGDLKLMLTTLASVPTGTGFLINTSDFAFMRPPGWDGYRWLTGDSGNILTQKQGTDSQFATAVDYWNFVCMDPGKQIKLYGILE